jgi:GLPGLI family protein
VGEAYKRGERSFQTKGEIGWKLFKHYPKRGEYAWLDGISTERYVCTEKAEEPTWTIVADSTAEVIGNPCQLAVTDFRGRRWYAWYTDDTPISEGPWKLCGLPGLIVEAVSDDGIHRFTLTELQHATAPIFYETNAITVKTSEEKLIKNRNKTFGNRLYPKDSHYYIANLQSVDVVYVDEGAIINGTFVNDKAHVYMPLEKE